MTPLLQTVELCCERDDRLLFDGLNLSINEGEIHRIEGPNGSGKTTLLRSLCGLSSRYKGEILWRGEPINKVRPAFLSELLYLGHSAGIKAALSPRENLNWHCAMKGVSDELVDGALDKVGLLGYEESPCYALSAGQQRRVGLARLFLGFTPLWVLDEPFTAIDRQGVKELEYWVDQHGQQGGTVLLTTHHELAISQSVKLIKLGSHQ